MNCQQLIKKKNKESKWFTFIQQIVADSILKKDVRKIIVIFPPDRINK